MRAELAFLISVRPFAPRIGNWKSFQVSRNTAPLNDTRLSSHEVFQPSSWLIRKSAWYGSRVPRRFTPPGRKPSERVA